MRIYWKETTKELAEMIGPRARAFTVSAGSMTANVEYGSQRIKPAKASIEFNNSDFYALGNFDGHIQVKQNGQLVLDISETPRLGQIGMHFSEDIAGGGSIRGIEYDMGLGALIITAKANNNVKVSECEFMVDKLLVDVPDHLPRKQVVLGISTILIVLVGSNEY